MIGRCFECKGEHELVNGRCLLCEHQRLRLAVHQATPAERPLRLEELGWLNDLIQESIG